MGMIHASAKAPHARPDAMRGGRPAPAPALNSTAGPEPDLARAWVVAALAADLGQRRLPHALDIRARLADGEPLNADDEAFLADMLETLARAGARFEHHPDIAALHRCARALYDDIMTAAFARTLPKSW